MALTQISTAGVKDDAVTSGKIPANAVGSSELADNAVDTAAIVDDAVTAGKLANDIAINTTGTITATSFSGPATQVSLASQSSDTDCFPVFSLTATGNQALFTKSNRLAFNSSTGALSATSFVGDGSNLTGITSTTINNNADNRVITGSGTANTLNGESGLIFDGTKLGIGTSSPHRVFEINNSQPCIRLTNGTNAYDIGTGGFVDGSDSLCIHDQGVGERLRLDSSGNVGIGNTDPKATLHVNSHKNVETDKHDASNYHLFVRNPEDDTSQGAGIGFSVTSNATKVGAGIYHVREGGGSQGSLRFATNVDGNTTREQMKLSSGGILTRPYTPSFAAFSTNLGTSRSFGQGHGSTLWDTNYLEPMPVWGNNQNGAQVSTIYNNGGDMSLHNFTTSGGQAGGYIKFTAPVTGTYVFWIAGCTIKTDNGDWVGFGIMKNNTSNYNSADLDYYISQMNAMDSDDRRSMNGQVTVPLNANDYIVLYARSPNVTAILDRIIFGGYQLY